MKTHRFYLNASNYLLNGLYNQKLNSNEKEYNYFASVVLSWIALETYINTLSESLSKGTRIRQHEKSFLNEHELRVNDWGIFEEIKIRPSTTKKILFIIHNFTKLKVKKFKQIKLWRDLQSFEDLRNKIIHYKEKHNLKINLNKATECKDLVQETINYLSKKLR